jgi:hypothetical protein
MSSVRLALRLGATVLTGIALMIPSATLASSRTPASTSASPRSGATVSASAAAHKGIVPPGAPAKSLLPKPYFLRSPHCAHGKDGSRCNALALKAIAHARKVLEKLGGMSFSLSAYEKLTPIEQLFATVDLERTERGLPPAVVLTRSLDKVAQQGANRDQDPNLQKVPDPLPGGGHLAGLGGNWAGGWGNALGADYGWMYDDGIGSDNGDCGRSHPSGCWGHRDNILGTFNGRARCGGGGRNELAMGAGHLAKGKKYGDSEVELFAGVCGPTPTDVVISWTRVKRLLHVR